MKQPLLFLYIMQILALYSCHCYCYKPMFTAKHRDNQVEAIYVTANDYLDICQRDEKSIHWQNWDICYRHQIKTVYYADTIVQLLNNLKRYPGNPVPMFNPESRLWMGMEIVTTKKRYYVGFYKNGAIIYQKKYFFYNPTLVKFAMLGMDTKLLETVPNHSIYFSTAREILKKRQQ